jgi:hypothetical protein
VLPDLGDVRLDIGLLAGPADDGRLGRAKKVVITKELAHVRICC